MTVGNGCLKTKWKVELRKCLSNNIKLTWWYNYTYSATLSPTDTNVLTHVSNSFHILKDLMDLFFENVEESL